MNNDWMIVPNWERFQHYGLARRPLWIKNYITLLHKDDYLDLPFAARGLLHGIWLAYADRDGQLRRSDLASALQGRVIDAHLASLNHAGLILSSASKPLHLSTKEETPPDLVVPPTNIRVVHNQKRERLHDQLLAAARRYAADWHGGTSDAFDAGLDELEHLTGSRLGAGDRYRLWDQAFHHVH